MRTLGQVLGFLLVGLFVCSQTALAGSVTRSLSFPNGLAASVTFKQSETDPNVLIVILTNTADCGAKVPTDVLTAVYFELEPFVTLTPESGMLYGGSTVLNYGPDGGGNVGGEYGFRDDLDRVEDIDLPSWAGRMVISAVGVGDFVGTHDVFPGENLYDQISPAGLAYGLVSSEGIGPGANSPLHSRPLVQDAVEFTLSGLGKDYELAEDSIRKVAFNYGTDFNPVVPLPSASLLGGAALGAMGLVGWCKRRRSLEAAA